MGHIPLLSLTSLSEFVLGHRLALASVIEKLGPALELYSSFLQKVLVMKELHWQGRWVCWEGQWARFRGDSYGYGLYERSVVASCRFLVSLTLNGSQ